MRYGIFLLILLSACTKSDSTQNYEDNPQRTVVLALGDSLTQGYGLPPEQSYPSLLQQKLKEMGTNLMVKNAGVNGDTTAGGLKRLDKILEEIGPDKIRVAIVALGGNDGFKRIPVAQTRASLQKIIEKLKAHQIKVVLVGIQFTLTKFSFGDRFAGLYPKLAEDNQVILVENILENVRGESDLNLRDGIHPNAEGYKVVAETIWEGLVTSLRLE